MIATSFIFVGITAGCRSQAAPQPKDENAEVAELRKHPLVTDKPLDVQQPSTEIARGPSPLVRIIDVGGPLRVMDLTANVQLAAITVPNGSLVRVDDEHGVMVNETSVRPGPLPSGHQYAISAEATTSNSIRRTIGIPSTMKSR